MEWIKCSERMPEVGVKVIFFPNNDEPIHGEWNGVAWTQDVSWSCAYDDGGIDNLVTIKVTHWMPLPQLPTE